jgi:hypothetical protein
VFCLEVKLLTNPIKKKGHMLQLFTLLLISINIFIYMYLLLNQIPLQLYNLLPIINLWFLVRYYADNFL